MALAVDDDFFAPCRRPQVPALPTAEEFLWELFEHTSVRWFNHFTLRGKIQRENCKTKISKAGSLYATLKALTRKGYIVAELRPEFRDWGWRFTDKGLDVVDESGARRYEARVDELTRQRERLARRAGRLVEELERARQDLAACEEDLARL